MATHPKVLGRTLDPKLTYSTHIHTISLHKPLQIIKIITTTGWGKQKETLMSTYKAALEYAFSIWSPLTSSTRIIKLQVIQNAALGTATGCTQDTNIQHLHDGTFILSIHEHLQLHASQHTTLQGYKNDKNNYFNKLPQTHTITTTDIKTNMRHRREDWTPPTRKGHESG